MPGLLKRSKYPTIKDMAELSECFRIVTDYVARAFGIPEDLLLSRSKIRKLTEPRQVIMYLLSKKCAYGWTVIGQIMDYNHSTIIAGVETAMNLMATEPDYKSRVDKIIEQLQHDHPHLIVVGSK